jgi:hypothetical protein
MRKAVMPGKSLCDSFAQSVGDERESSQVSLMAWCHASPECARRMK